MGKSFFESLFGDAWNGFFSDNLFNYQETKMIGNGIGSMALKEEEGKYVQRFPLGNDVDPNFLKVNVDTKERRVTVTYEKEDEHSSVHYKYVRSIPEDADFSTAHAEANDSCLTVSFKKKEDEGQKPKDIPIEIGE